MPFVASTTPHRPYRSGCVENFEHALLSINFHLFSVAVLNGWIVLFYENPLHKLHCERRFAHTTATKDDDFVFTHLRNRLVCFVCVLSEIRAVVGFDSVAKPSGPHSLSLYRCCPSALYQVDHQSKQQSVTSRNDNKNVQFLIFTSNYTLAGCTWVIHSNGKHIQILFTKYTKNQQPLSIQWDWERNINRNGTDVNLISDWPLASVVSFCSTNSIWIRWMGGKICARIKDLKFHSHTIDLFFVIRTQATISPSCAHQSAPNNSDSLR